MRQIKKSNSINNIILRIFPSSENEKPNLSIGLTNHFLVLLDSSGKIRIYHIVDGTFIIEYNNDY